MLTCKSSYLTSDLFYVCCLVYTVKVIWRLSSFQTLGAPLCIIPGNAGTCVEHRIGIFKVPGGIWTHSSEGQVIISQWILQLGHGALDPLISSTITVVFSRNLVLSAELRSDEKWLLNLKCEYHYTNILLLIQQFSKWK